MIEAILDVRSKVTPLTFKGAGSFPVTIRGMGLPGVCGKEGQEVAISLTERDMVFLSNFLTDSLVQLGVPDGGG